MREDNDIFDEITIAGMAFLMGGLSVVISDAKKAGKKSILIKDIERVIGSTIKFQKEHPERS